MPKEHFSIANATSLASLKPKSKIHVSGVAGVAMAQLAVALSKAGYSVSGSDKEFYEPMGSFLRNSTVELKKGYSAKNIPADVGLVIIGNALSYGNEEVSEVEQKAYPYTLFPKVLYDTAIKGRHSIVVSGTHGKSTTTSIIAWLLSRMNLDPSYFIGAAVPGLDTSLQIGTGRYSVVEGDEYDSAFFAKVPKFTFYSPDTLIITAIEYDHADIYPDLSSIVAEFTKLVGSLGKGKRILACVDCSNVRKLVPEWRAGCDAEIVTYGYHEQADFRITQNDVVGQRQRVQTVFNRGGEFDFELTIPGRHNALNAAAALLACLVNDLDYEQVCMLLPGFEGARRRQEVRLNTPDSILIDDFAHHPTAVRETIGAVRAFYPGRRLWAIFEPRSNTSRRKVFQNDYISALKSADRVVLCEVTSRNIDTGHDLIEVSALADKIGLAGTPAVALANAQAIHDYLMTHREQGDLFLVMSNGSFDGLVEKLEKSLKKGG